MCDGTETESTEMGTDASTTPNQPPAAAPAAAATPTPPPIPAPPAQTTGPTFTQADVDRIVSRELAQQARNKFGDYDDLKAKAGTSQTLETRIADLEKSSSASEQRALRAEIAAEFGISTKKGANNTPSDAELFLTGTDENTLRAQAARLSEQAAERRRKGNVAPREGGAAVTSNLSPQDQAKRDWLRSLQGDAD